VGSVEDALEQEYVQRRLTSDNRGIKPAVINKHSFFIGSYTWQEMFLTGIYNPMNIYQPNRTIDYTTNPSST